MAIAKQEKVSIFGAGLVGCVLAMFLARKGYKVHLIERRADMRTFGTGEGRSINLALSERGWRAIRALGIDKEIFQIGIPMAGRMMHAVAGGTQFQPYGKNNQAIFSVSRFELNKKLLSLVEKEENIHISFNSRVTYVNLKLTEANIMDTITGEVRVEDADYFMGADGAYSAVRLGMMKIPRFNFSQHYIDHGYKELTIYPNEHGEFALAANSLHIWPRGHFMMIALPNPDKTFTCTLFLPFEGKPSFETLQDPQQLQEFFATYFPDILPMLPDLQQQYYNNPTGTLVTTQAFPWVAYNTALIGDAAHAIVPFYGQGMNAGFEDCVVLDDLIEIYGSLKEALPHYQIARKKDTDAIAQLALGNFIEMRDHVGKPEFLIRKQLDAVLNDLFPTIWIPIYTLISFSNTPYSTAQKRGSSQDKVLDQLMKHENISDILTHKEVLRKLAAPLIENLPHYISE